MKMFKKKKKKKKGDISSLIASTALNKKISVLVKKTNYHTNISEIEKKILDHNHDK